MESREERAGRLAWLAALTLAQAALLARDLRCEAAHEAGAAADRELAQALALRGAPRRWSPRELRVLPGIGERLALSVLDARRAGAERWEEVPGIGPRTSAQVRGWLAAHGLPQELAP